MAKIILVDDDQAIAAVFDTVLRKSGYETVVAHTGKEGLDKIKTEKADLVLLDQILPDMNGNEILKLIKADPQTQNTPVAILSNFGQNELIQEAMNAGAADYILKYQIEPEDLINKLKGILGQGTSQTVKVEPKTQQAAQAEVEAAAKSIVEPIVEPAQPEVKQTEPVINPVEPKIEVKVEPVVQQASNQEVKPEAVPTAQPVEKPVETGIVN